MVSLPIEIVQRFTPGYISHGQEIYLRNIPARFVLATCLFYLPLAYFIDYIFDLSDFYDLPDQIINRITPVTPRGI
jgi:hypothetical protein